MTKFRYRKCLNCGHKMYSKAGVCAHREFGTRCPCRQYKTHDVVIGC